VVAQVGGGRASAVSATLGPCCEKGPDCTALTKKTECRRTSPASLLVPGAVCEVNGDVQEVVEVVSQFGMAVGPFVGGDEDREIALFHAARGSDKSAGERIECGLHFGLGPINRGAESKQ